MLISIIVPVYQAGQYLDRLMESIVSQCDRDIEVLLVDDGSTDNSPRLCDHYAGSYDFIHAFHKENGGVSSARNYGLSEARGEYIIFADADDEYVDGAISQIRERCLAGGWDLMVFSHYRLLQDGSHDNKTPYQGIVSIQTIKDQYAQYLYDINSNPVWNKVFVRDIIKAYDLSFPDMKIGEDAFFAYTYLKYCHTVYFEQKVLYRYHQNEDSSVHRYSSSRWSDENQLIGLCEELAVEWGYSKSQSEEMTANLYRNALLYELYNVLVKDCPMRMIQKVRYLRSLLDFSLENNRLEQISGDGLTRMKKFQLWMLRHRAILPLLCLVEAKRVISGERNE